MGRGTARAQHHGRLQRLASAVLPGQSQQSRADGGVSGEDVLDPRVIRRRHAKSDQVTAESNASQWPALSSALPTAGVASPLAVASVLTRGPAFVDGSVVGSSPASWPWPRRPGVPERGRLLPRRRRAPSPCADEHALHRRPCGAVPVPQRGPARARHPRHDGVRDGQQPLGLDRPAGQPGIRAHGMRQRHLLRRHHDAGRPGLPGPPSDLRARAPRRRPGARRRFALARRARVRQPRLRRLRAARAPHAGLRSDAPARRGLASRRVRRRRRSTKTSRRRTRSRSTRRPGSPTSPARTRAARASTW